MSNVFHILFSKVLDVCWVGCLLAGLCDESRRLMVKLTPSYTSFNAIHRSLEFTLTRGQAIVITHFYEVSELRFVSHLHAEDNWIIKNPLFLRMRKQFKIQSILDYFEKINRKENIQWF